MYISNATNYLTQYVTVSSAPRPASSTTSNAVQPSSAETARLGRTLAQSKELQQSLLDLDQLAKAALTKRGRAATVVSSTDLGFGSAAPVKISSSADIGLLAASTPAMLRSNAEVNATPTSFSPFGPDWVGSTLQPTVSGAYNGLNGTGTLTFEVNSGGTRGADNLQIRVYDPVQDHVDTIDIDRDDPTGTEYTLANGLVLTFGQGDLIDADTFTVDVNAGDPDAYSPTEPVWAGSSALATVGGVYDGTNGTDTLTFQVDREGIHGEDDLKIKVYDSSQSRIDSFDINKEDPLDQEYVLANGLSVTFGEGFLRKSTTFTTDVFDSVGSIVDPSKPLNGTRDLDPNLESGLAVSPGAFEVNGVSISVNAGDSIDDVLARINTLQIGVNASFDAASESVVLTQLTSGSAPTITVGNDTSGFLAATKLAAAAVEPGIDRDAVVKIDTVGAFSAIGSGSVSVNGVGISIDPAADSLLDVLARITASGAGVTASLDESGQRVLLDSSQADVDLVLDGGTTGLFAALNIAEGTHVPSAVQEPDSMLSSVVAFSGVQSGSIQLNGVDIAVDVDTDSFEDVVARINDAQAGVAAMLTNASSRLTLVQRNPKSSLAIAEGTTGFFTALGIAEGAHQPTKAKRGLSSARARELSEAVGKVASSMNGLFATNVLGGAQEPALTKLRDEIENTVRQSVAPGGSALGKRYGIRVDFGAKYGRVFDFNAQDQDRFQSAVRSHYKPVRTLLIESLSRRNDGLVGGLSQVVEKAYRDLSAQGRQGLIFNSFA